MFDTITRSWTRGAAFLAVVVIGVGAGLALECVEVVGLVLVRLAGRSRS